MCRSNILVIQSRSAYDSNHGSAPLVGGLCWPSDRAFAAIVGFGALAGPAERAAGGLGEANPGLPPFVNSTPAASSAGRSASIAAFASAPFSMRVTVQTRHQLQKELLRAFPCLAYQEVSECQFVVRATERRQLVVIVGGFARASITSPGPIESHHIPPRAVGCGTDN
jgi:hypothetical protein